MKDNPLPLPGLFDALHRGLVRICPICDAYEVIDQKIGVVGQGEHGAREALFLRDYSDRVVLLLVGGDAESLEPTTLREARVDVVETAIGEVIIKKDRIVAVDHGDGLRRTYDVIYSALGSTAQSGLAEAACANVNDMGCLIVDEHQRTSVEGLYVAGDVVRGLDQISVAQAEGAIHNRLREVRPMAVRMSTGVI